MCSQSAQTRARPLGASRAGAITSRTNSSAAWSTVASWSSSFEPKWAKRPLLLMPVASASRPIESGSRPSSVASGGGDVEDRVARALAFRLQHDRPILAASDPKFQLDRLDRKARSFYYRPHGDRPPHRSGLGLRGEQGVLRARARPARARRPARLAGSAARVLRRQGRAQLALGRRVGRGRQPRRHARVPRAPTSVDWFHAAALGASAESVQEPGFRGEYNRDYYAARVLDPDGNAIEVVHRATADADRLAAQSPSPCPGSDPGTLRAEPAGDPLAELLALVLLQGSGPRPRAARRAPRPGSARQNAPPPAARRSGRSR